MPKAIVFKVGDKYGDLTVSGQPVVNKKRRYVPCDCVCGNKTLVQVSKLTTGYTRSCGCLVGRTASERNRTHGMSHKHPLYVTWQGIRARCFNPRHAAYHRYGGRGVTLCDRWAGEDGFPNFVADMGERPSDKHSVDRINPDKGYSPDNCRWSPSRVQSHNSSQCKSTMGYQQLKAIRDMTDAEFKEYTNQMYGT